MGIDPYGRARHAAAAAQERLEERATGRKWQQTETPSWLC
jgi:hypothetical protein